MIDQLPPQLEDLKNHTRWVGIRKEKIKGSNPPRWEKKPYIPGGGGCYAKNNDPTTWRSFEEAQAMKGVDDVAYALTGDRVHVAMDVDQCFNDGVIADWAKEIIDEAN